MEPLGTQPSGFGYLGQPMPGFGSSFPGSNGLLGKNGNFDQFGMFPGAIPVQNVGQMPFYSQAPLQTRDTKKTKKNEKDCGKDDADCEED